jgi:hypothetical protein
MSNGVRWYVPEATGGIPVYVEGEVPAAPELTAGDGDGQPQGLDLGPKVEAVITRATELGHAALSDRATIELTLGSRSPDVVNRWVRQATGQLDVMEVVPDAEVVADPEVEAPEIDAVPEVQPEEIPGLTEADQQALAWLDEGLKGGVDGE